MEDTIQALANRLKKPLPGWNAHSQMATQVHRNARVLPKPNARVAAVLMLLFPHHRQLHLPLILRPTYEGVHSGQMALPGGKVEPQDEDLIATALRETEEEIGVRVDRNQVLGQLTDLFIPPSNIVVTPIVAYYPEEPVYVLDPLEVADIANIPLEALMHIPNQIVTQVKVTGGFTLEAPAFKINDKIIWGATAMMLSELLGVFDEIF